MTLSEQIAPVLVLARKKWQVVVPEWLQPEAKSDYWWDARLYPKGNERSTHVAIHPDAAALIVTGALAKWLAGQGIKVFRYANIWHIERGLIGEWPAATNHLSALLAATNARLDELPDKEKA